MILFLNKKFPPQQPIHVVALEEHQAVGMGRLIGDGLYYIIADLVERPAHQKKGIGTEIIHMLLAYVDGKTPLGGRSSIQLIAEKGKRSFL